MIHLLLVMLLAITPADAKTKTASTRVAETFKALPQLTLPRQKVARPAPAKKGLTEDDYQSYTDEDWKPKAMPPRTFLKSVWIKPPPAYIANRPAFFSAGKLMIYRECEVDLLQDPGEHTCHPVWAWL